MTYTVTATAPAAGYFSNSAVVTPPTGVNDPDPLDNTGGPVITSVDLVIADLVLQKNGTPVVQTGGTVHYSLIISNAGPDGANGATFSDTLPASLTGVSAICENANAGAGCPGSVTVGGGAVTGTIPTLPAGGSVVITITGTAPATAGNLNNTAVVSAPTGVSDFNTTNNSGQAVTVVISQPVPAQANLAVVKAGTTTVETNGTIKWQFRVINAGPGAANNATISDPIPAGVTGTTWTCTASGGAVCPAASGSGNISQTVATFPAGGLLIYNLTGTAPGSATSITNTVTVTPPGGVTDPDTSDNSATQVTTVQTGAPTQADLVVAKYGPTNVLPYATFDYTIIVRNNGPAAANGATIMDNLPDELTAVSASCAAAGGALCGSTSVGAGNLLTGTITTLPLNGSVTYTVTATAPASGYFSNSATVTPPTGVTDPDPTDNTGGPVFTSVEILQADLAIQKNGTPVVQTNGTINYSLTISNLGPDAANGSTFTDTLPAGLTGVAASCDGANGGAACPGSLTASNSSVSGTIPTLPLGGSVVISISATAPGATATLTNTATVTVPAGVIDPVSANNTGTVKTDVTTAPVPAVANLAVSKTGTTTVTTSGSIKWQVRVINAGPGHANGATLNDPLPAGVTGATWACVATGGAACPSATGSGNISGTISTLPAGGQLIYNLTATAPGTATTITNTATIAPPTGVTDPDTTDNTASLPTTVQTTAPTQADLSIRKLGTTNILPRGQVVYTIEVANEGPAAANGAVVTDNLPDTLIGISVTCATTGGAVCGSSTIGAGNLLSAIITTLPSGATVSYTVTATGPTEGSFSNVATVTPPTGVNDPNPEDNTSGPVITTVEPIVDLLVQKNGTPMVTAGGTMTYTIEVSNLGPSDAGGATFTDTIPNGATGMTGVTATCGSAVAGAVCPSSLTVSSAAVTGTIPTLPAGSSVVITITGTAPATATTLTNAVVVSAPAHVREDITSNNSSMAKTEVVTQPLPPQADLVVTKAGSSTVQTGQTISYLITVTNAGPGAANGAVLADTFPTGITSPTWSCLASGGAVCPNLTGSGNINQTIATFPSNGQLIYLVSGTAGAAATLSNTVTITPPSGVTDPETTNNSATQTTVVQSTAPTKADLHIVKRGPANLQPYEVFSYTLEIVNKGPGAANGAVVTDNLPDALTSVVASCATLNGAVCATPSVGSGNLVTVTLSTMPVGGQVTITITAKAPASGYFSNSAVVETPPGVEDPDPQDNTGGPVNTMVDPRLDLVLQMNGNTTVQVGGTITWTLLLTNAGLAAADGATFNQVLPPGVTGAVAVCGLANAGAVCPGSVTVSGANVSGSIPTLPPGGSVMITVTATAPATTGKLTSTSVLTAPGAAIETDLTNNNGLAKTDVAFQWAPTVANLALSKAGTNVVQAGGTVRWQVRVFNAGPAAANGALFADTVPVAVTGVTWNCQSSGGAVCPVASGSGNVISQSIATFPALGVLYYTIMGTAPGSAQTINNTATITPPAGLTDPDPSDNTSTQPTIVQATPPSEADLVITKTGPSTVMGNETFSYKILVRNTGPATANGAVITDNLPDAIVSPMAMCMASGGAMCGAYSITSNVLTATIATLPVGGSVTLSITANAPTSGSFVNSAVVTPPPGVNDPDPLDNTAGPVITGVDGNLSQQVDLAITKTDGATTAIPGTNHIYTVVVSNLGQNPVTGASVVDNFSSMISSAQWTCTATGTTCPNGTGTGNLNETVNLPVGSSLTYRIVTRIAPSATGILVNTAMVNIPNGLSDSNLTNNTATDGNTTLVPTSDLVIQPNATPIVETGGTIRYTFEITNLGPSDALNVPTQSTIGGGFTLTSATCGSAVDGAVCPSSSTITPGLISATIPLLPAGGNLVFTLNGLAPMTANDITNVATVSAPPGVVDLHPETNVGTVTTVVTNKPIPREANVAVTKAGTNVVQINGSVGYMVTLTNAGPFSADGSIFTDSVPAGFTNVAWTCVASGGAACPNASGTGSPIVQMIMTFPANGQLIYRVTATAPPTPTAILVSDPGNQQFLLADPDQKKPSINLVQNLDGVTRAQVAGDVTLTLPAGVVDTDPTDNQSVAQTRVITGVPPVSDVTIAKTGPTNTSSYSLLTYTLEVTNNGPDPADGTVVTDDVSNLLSNVGATCTADYGAVCGPITIGAGGVVRAEIPTFPEFGRVVYKVTATAPLSGFFSNSATVTLNGGQNDPSFEDNTGGPVNTFVGPFFADLVIQNNGTPLVKTNDPVVYTLLLTNLGPRSAGGATLRNILPPELGNVTVECSNAAAGASCPSSLVINNGILTGTIPTFPTGGNITITIRGTAPGYRTSLLNQASIIPPGSVPDPILGNNSASALTRVTDSPIPPEANLTVTKVGPSTIQVGGTIRYQVIVVNSGPASADGARFTDLVPSAITGVTWTCSPAGGALCPAASGTGNAIVQTIAALPVNGSLTYVINGTAPATAQSLSNTATVSLPPGMTDADLTDNASTALTRVQTNAPTEADLVIAKTGPSNVSSGASFSYTVEVTNTGPAQADGAVVTDNLSDLLTNVYVRCTADQGAICGTASIGSGNQMTATIASLPVEGRVTYTITATAPSIGFFSNSAVVTPPPGVNDPDPIDNLGGPVMTSTLTLPRTPGNQDAGSILIYTVYTSTAWPSREDTRITLTNTHQRLPVNVHLFFVDGATGKVADNYVTLTPQQTTSFLASGVDPGVTGYLIAVPVDDHGCPINFNYLIGDAYVNFESGHRASLSAWAIQALGGPIICDPSATTARLYFDGVSYSNLPRILAANSLASRGDGNQMMLVVNRISGDLTTGLNSVESLTGFLFDDVERASKFTMQSASSQLRSMIGNNTPRTVPRYDAVIPVGRTGWMKFSSDSDVGLTGALINLNPNGFSGGHNLHILTTTDTAFITIPVYRPQ